MKKTITIFGVLAIASAPTLALNITPHKIQNLQNILKQTATKTNGAVNNQIVVQALSSEHFKFEMILGNSTYNGFPGFMNQLVISHSYQGRGWGAFFFQWLDDDDFHTGPFPELNSHTAHGFFHDPLVWGNRLENHMGHFGGLFDDKSDTAWDMIYEYLNWNPFGKNVENTYNKDASSGKVAGISFEFAFSYDGNQYFAANPTFNVIMNQ